MRARARLPASTATVIAAALLALPAVAVAFGGLAGQVRLKTAGLFGVKDAKDRSGVVIWLDKVPGTPPRAPVMPAIRQRGLQFAPRVVAVTRGGQVEFPNDDKVFHNVFSLSKPAKFDLGLYKSGSTRAVTFDRAGTVDVYCNIHPEMEAIVRVLDGPWYAVTGADGKFEIKDLPPGAYPVVAWPARGKEWRGTVTIVEGKIATLDIEVTEETVVQDHTRKDGTPYGRYQ